MRDSSKALDLDEDEAPGEIAKAINAACLSSGNQEGKGVADNGQFIRRSYKDGPALGLYLDTVGRNHRAPPWIRR